MNLKILTKIENFMKRFPLKEIVVLGVVVIGSMMIYLWVLGQMGIL